MLSDILFENGPGSCWVVYFTVSAGAGEPWSTYPAVHKVSENLLSQALRRPCRGVGLQSLQRWVTGLPRKTRRPGGDASFGGPGGLRSSQFSSSLSLCTVPGLQGDPLSPQIDLQKMPLGKLSKRQIQAAYSILSEVQQVSEGLAPPLSQLPLGSLGPTSHPGGVAVHLFRVSEIDIPSHNS